LNGGKLPRKNRFDLRWNSVSHHGMLDVQQAIAMHEQLFQKADADGDGKLSEAEIRHALSAQNLNVGLL